MPLLVSINHSTITENTTTTEHVNRLATQEDTDNEKMRETKPMKSTQEGSRADGCTESVIRDLASGNLLQLSSRVRREEADFQSGRTAVRKRPPTTSTTLLLRMIYGSGKRNSTRAHFATIRSFPRFSALRSSLDYVPCREECRLCGGGGLPPASTLLPLWLSS